MAATARKITGRVTQIGGPEVDHRLLVAIDRHRERREEAHIGQQCNQGIDRLPTFWSGGAQEAEADAQERAQQDEVAEVAEMNHLGAGPTNQGQL